MTMLMKPSKTQVPSLVRRTTLGTTTFNRSLAAQAGYTSVEAFIVGGCGGRGGNAKYNSGNISFGAGGGGGGSLRVKAALSALPSPCIIGVGGAGLDGGDAGPGNAIGGGFGGNGGDSVFGDWVADGGQGGGGGFIRIGGANEIIASSEGGDGGGNSLNLGAGGTGGHVQDDFADQNTNPVDPPDNGTFVLNTTPPIYRGGGKGGGGGGGAVKGGGNVVYAGQNGAKGSDTTYSMIGGAPETNKGGHGGGANVYGLSAPLVAPSTQDYFGGQGMQGVVVYELS